MIRHSARLAAAAVVCGLLVIGVAGASASTRRTVHFTSSCAGRLSGETTSTGSCHSAQLGNYTFVTKEALPNFTSTYTFKGGKLYVKGSDKLSAAGAVGTFRIVRGTGRFSGATGSASEIGKLIAGGTRSTVKGTITY